jgi:hypothetical protein
MTEYEYILTHDGERYCLYYDIDDGLRGPLSRVPPRDSDYTWVAALRAAYLITSTPDQEGPWKEVPLEDLPSKPLESDVLDSYHEGVWYEQCQARCR